MRYPLTQVQEPWPPKNFEAANSNTREDGSPSAIVREGGVIRKQSTPCRLPENHPALEGLSHQSV